MADDELSAQFHDFLTYYAFLTLVLMTALFWHVSFLIGMGFVTSYLLLSKTTALNL